VRVCPALTTVLSVPDETKSEKISSSWFIRLHYIKLFTMLMY